MKRIVIGLFVMTLSQTATATSLEKVKIALRKNPDVKWKAGENRIPDRLRSVKVVARGGDIIDQTEQITFGEIYRTTNEEENLLPAYFDWRDKDGVDFMSDVTAQGECGSCVAFASVATLETTLNIACETPHRSFDLSEQYAFSCGGGRCGPGWKVSQAANFVAEHGVPDITCLPYGAHDGEDVGCEMACSDADQRLVRGVTWTRPTTGFINVNAIKQALMNGPLLANMILFEDLEHYQSGVYRHVEGNQEGGHAIVLIGWDDENAAWIARNSWGPGWGDNGYFKVAWDDVSLPGRYTYLFDVGQSVTEGICSFPR